MIAYKRLRATPGNVSTNFDERDIGGSGGQPDFAGYRLDATGVTATFAMTIKLPRVNQCEGKMIHFITVNPNLKFIQIGTPTGSTERIVANSTETATLTNSVDFGQVLLACDGTRWFAIGDGSFT